MSSSSSSDSGGSSSSFDYESEAYGATDSINDFSVAEGGSGGDQETYNQIMNDYSPDKNKIAAQEEIRLQNIKDQNTLDYEATAYSTVPTIAVPQFDDKGKFIGVKNTDVGIVKGEQYTSANIQGIMLDSTINDKDKVDILNRLQAIANSPYDSGKPNVDDSAKAYMQNAIEVSLDSLKNDSFYDDFTSQIDVNSKTYNDTFRADPLGVYGEALTKSVGKNLLMGGAVNPVGVAMGIIFNSAKDAYGNKKALDALGFDGKKLKPNYSEVGDGGGILTNKEYLLGNTLNRDEVNDAIPNLNLPTNTNPSDNLPDSVVNKYYDNNYGKNTDFNKNYNSIKTANSIKFNDANKYTMSTNTGIFNQYLKERGLL